VSKRSIPVKSKIEVTDNEDNSEYLENIVIDSVRFKEEEDKTTQMSQSAPNKTNI
jgi:hypothetical protein